MRNRLAELLFKKKGTGFKEKHMSKKRDIKINYTNGKGSIPRPLSVSREEYDCAWDRIFRPVEKDKKSESKQNHEE